MKLIMQDNGFCNGVELKRNPTEEEIMFCLHDILGFDTEFALSENDTNDGFAEEKEHMCNVFIKFIKGEIEWWALCEAVCCYEAMEEFTIGIFAHLLTWLKEKEII